ncbi:putative tRNA(Ala)(adenine(37)) deaminase [Microsporum audouinii]
MSPTSSLECRVATLVHAHFEALPQRSKPNVHNKGLREWIPLSGIVLVTNENTAEEALTCVSVATGAKCLSTSQIAQCNGLVLHDSHAEILALRAFNHWLLEECKSALTHYKEKHINCSCIGSPYDGTLNYKGPSTCSGSRFLQWNLESVERIENSRDSKNGNLQTSIPWPPFRIKEDVNIWMYCSCAPCGDASMELCMAAQEDATPWDLPVPEAGDSETSTEPPHALLNGRAHFSILGVVRRKPSRADAESTLSKSCSDKLALKQVTSILSFPTSLLVAPTSNAYISNIILPEDELNRVGCNRSFGNGETGRMRALNSCVWETKSTADEIFTFRPFRVNSLPMEVFKTIWKYGKPTAKLPEEKVKTGNVSAVWTASPSFSLRPLFTAKGNDVPRFSELEWYKTYIKTAPTNLNETLINGVKQGYRLDSPGFKKASALSRDRMWALLRDVFYILDGRGVMPDRGENACISNLTQIVLSAPSYDSLKYMAARTGNLHARAQVLTDARLVLKNWIQNHGDGAWGLSVFDIPMKEKVARLETTRVG